MDKKFYQIKYGPLVDLLSVVAVEEMDGGSFKILTATRVIEVSLRASYLREANKHLGYDITIHLIRDAGEGLGGIRHAMNRAEAMERIVYTRSKIVAKERNSLIKALKNV